MARSKMIQQQIDALLELEGAKVEAGWFETDRYPSENGGEGELVARRAAFLEEGGFIAMDTPVGPVKAYVPPRPFMRYASMVFASTRKSIENRIAKKVFSGKITAEQALGQIGIAMENCIVDSIQQGTWAPNAPYTVKKKGFDKPLIETGHMWQTVSSKVVK